MRNESLIEDVTVIVSGFATAFLNVFGFIPEGLTELLPSMNAVIESFVLGAMGGLGAYLIKEISKWILLKFKNKK